MVLKSATVQRLDITADELVSGLLKLSETEHVSLLDSCGVGHLGSHLIIAGIRPTAADTINVDPAVALHALSQRLEGNDPCIFTLSYELGASLSGVSHRPTDEPRAFFACFDHLIIHDYDSGQTKLVGKADPKGTEARIRTAASHFQETRGNSSSTARSDNDREAYMASVAAVQERIRAGDTYQTNFTQEITLENAARPSDVFWRLRRDHPAPFAAYITRGDSTVVSASPERFFKADPLERLITTSPIKGTRPRGSTPEDDARLRHDLLASSKDRAENTMIVDLLRNDLGRICEYGSVRVDKLCELEEHPTLFHLVSTITGDLRSGVTFSDMIRALFPCGSITGAPKINTMKIIEELEPGPRGLSMGAIGYSIPSGLGDLDPVVDLSVAIRTIVFRQGTATFNVGGGITIDSDPAEEYEESLLKARALLTALGARF